MKANKGVVAILMAVAFAVTGCATSTGNSAITDPNTVAAIQPGKTTTKDVENMLGRPSNVELAESGEQVWTYQSIQNSAMASIPFLNMMGRNGTENTLTIRFTKKGVVKAMGRGQNKL